MELEQRWCDNATCRDYGKVGAGNIKAFSHVERRYYCATCRRTFSEDKHTSFETLRCPRTTHDGTRSFVPVGRAQQPEGGGTSDAPLPESRAPLAGLGGTAWCVGQRRVRPRSAPHPSPEDRRVLDVSRRESGMFPTSDQIALVK